jgi:hypothetical protein
VLRPQTEDSQLSEAQVDQQLRDQGPWGPAGPPGPLGPGELRRRARQAASRGAADALKCLGMLLYLAENCLAIVLAHFLRVGG